MGFQVTCLPQCLAPAGASQVCYHYPESAWLGLLEPWMGGAACWGQRRGGDLGPALWHVRFDHGWRGRTCEEAVYGAGGEGDTGKGHMNTDIHLCQALCVWVLRKGCLEEAHLFQA